MRRHADGSQIVSAVVVDDYSMWLETIVRVVEAAGVDVVEATTEQGAALAALERERPGIFILGLDRARSTPADAESLLETAARLQQVSTIVIADDDDPEVIDGYLSRGVSAYVLKSILAEDFAAAVRQAVDRCVYLFGRPSDADAAAGDDLPHLTTRELEVLLLVAEGLSNAEVARRLWLSVATVKFHLARTYEKLGVANRTGAVRWAQLHGLLGSNAGHHSPSGS